MWEVTFCQLYGHSWLRFVEGVRDDSVKHEEAGRGLEFASASACETVLTVKTHGIYLAERR